MRSGIIRATEMERFSCSRVALCLGALILFLGPVSFTQQDAAGQAAALMQAGRFHDAEVLWRQLAQSYPKNPSVHAGLGISLAQQGDLPGAAAEYRKSLAINPHQPDITFDLGLAEFKQGHFGAAIPLFKTVAAARPQDGRSTLLLGMSYYGLHQYGKAIPYLKTASAADPANLELHNVLAQSCLSDKQYDCALSEFKDILNVNPDAVQAHMLMAVALDGMSKTPEAIAELEAAERIAPNEPNLHFELGYLYYRERDYDRAVSEFNLELKNNDRYAQAYAYLGDIALHKNEDSQAEPLLTKAIHLQSDMRLAYFDLGCVYANEKRNPEALAAFLRAERLDPTEPDAHYRLARLYASLGQKQKADQEFAKTKALHAKTEESLIQKISGPGAPATQ